MKKKVNVGVVVALLLVAVVLAFVFWPKPECYTNTECQNRDIMRPYCDGNTVLKDSVSFTCENPGTRSASCERNVEVEEVEICVSPQTCVSGSCQG